MTEAGFLKLALGFYGACLGFTVLACLFPQRWIRILAEGAFLTGLGGHAATVVTRGILANHFPVASFYESLLFISLTTAVCLAVATRVVALPSLRIGGLLVLLGALLTCLKLDRTMEPLMPALRSIWIRIHVPVMMTSYGAFAVAAISGTLDLSLKKKHPPGQLEELTSRFIAFGFIFLTLGILLGAIWANEAWGTYWGWDPKETWALITWLIYAIYLHGKYVTGWKGRRLAWVAVFGFGAVLFTYLGVSFLLSGLHSYI